MGIGEQLCYASFDKARQLGAKRIILYSNKLQQTAIRLYERIGFRHLEVEPGTYKRANVKMEILVDEILKKQIQINEIERYNG
jgi:ribosomal protein S18 acetylase RimI-like enzyme